ncbi:hypothetical protein HPB50_023605 [Hyalomma asiaticum]|uniref:Uncharacterized protein n=1 Tax=Hyalomma asiaticum TaxID=266040 RepID=A0ACB7TAB1_HYAAI|nr:hypothetical protein HPB50_023605 [Hyalomma asiaticum]
MTEKGKPPLQARISSELLARKPRKPTAAECCGNGCALCVNDVYEQELAIWENECMRELQYGPGHREVVYPQGRMSKYIKTLKEGCSVEWRGPLGGLDYKPNEETKVEDLKYGDEVHCREIDEELLEVELSKYPTPPHVLLCGPNAFNSRFVNYLKRRTGSVTWHVF